MNEYDLFDAFGGIDPDLLERSERKPIRKLPIRKALIAAAAVLALTATVFAAPKLKELLFGSRISHQVNTGIMYADNGLCFSVDACYEVDLTLPCAETAPQYIEEHRLPTYFEENGWNCDSSHVTLEDNYFGVHYLFSVPDAPQYWVFFEQAPFSLQEPRGRRQFLMNAGRTGVVVETAITIGEIEGKVYMVEPSEADGEPGQKNLVWSDGEYAYYMECGNQVTDEMIAGIVLSLAPLEDITPYYEEYDPGVPEDRMLPIETFYTLADVPEGYTLTQRRWNINIAHQEWELDDTHAICFSQDRLISEFNAGPALSIDGTMADVMTCMEPYEYDPTEVNGIIYHIVRQQGDTFAMWQDEEYVYLLRFTGQDLPTRTMMAFIDTVEPMPNFTDHLTE